MLRADNGLIKIGQTQHLTQRIARLNSILPYDLETVYLFAHTAYVELETYLHICFCEQRVRGEWFDLTPDDIGRIPILVRDMPAQQAFLV